MNTTNAMNESPKDSITIYRRRSRPLDTKRAEALARHLGIEGRTHATDDAVACTDGRRTLAFASPCARFGGLVFFADSGASLGSAEGKVLPAERARAWTEETLKRFELLPEAAGDGARLDLTLEAAETEAVVFDGRERRRVKAKTDVTSRITLDGVPVVGPRAKVRLAFKERELPALMHVGLWSALGTHEERRRVSEHEAMRRVQDGMARRNDCHGRSWDLVDLRLVYWAGEFGGGPDLLVPEYHVEVQLREAHAKAAPPAPGPRQVLRVPAWQ